MMTSGVAFRDYMTMPGLSATALKAGRTSMLHMREVVAGPPKDATPAMRLGTLIHAAILEPQLFIARAAVWTGAQKRGAAWEEFKDRNDSEWIVTEEEYGSMMSISAAVHGHRDAHRLVAETEHEVCVDWSSPRYGAARARFDGYGEHVGLVEVKTTRQIALSAFCRGAYNMGYHLQLGWYQIGAEVNVGHGNIPVHVIIIEQTRPYDVVVARVPQPILDRGRDEAESIAVNYRICERVHAFSGVADGIVDYELPTWAGGGDDGGLSDEAVGKLVEMEAGSL